MVMISVMVLVCSWERIVRLRIFTIWAEKGLKVEGTTLRYRRLRALNSELESSSSTYYRCSWGGCCHVCLYGNIYFTLPTMSWTTLAKKKQNRKVYNNTDTVDYTS